MDVVMAPPHTQPRCPQRLPPGAGYFNPTRDKLFQSLHRMIAWGQSATLREGQLLADIVAKVFLGWRTKILRAADAFYVRRREGSYRFIQNRSRTFVAALKSDAAAEKSKDQLSRDFKGCTIFDFCNTIGAKRTFGRTRTSQKGQTQTKRFEAPRELRPLAATHMARIAPYCGFSELARLSGWTGPI